MFIETMPFGGVGYSGMGHYYGKAGFERFLDGQANTALITAPDVAIEHLFPKLTRRRRSKHSASGLSIERKGRPRFRSEA